MARRLRREVGERHTAEQAYGVSGDVHSLVYAALGAAWVAALAIVLRRLRRDGRPLLQRELTPETT
jgi:hypothetical protein